MSARLRSTEAASLLNPEAERRLVRSLLIMLLLLAASSVAGAEYSANGADTCLMCHTDTTTHGIFQTRHGSPGQPDGPFSTDGLQCEACHGPGGEHAQNPMTSTPRADSDGCAGCHADHGETHEAMACGDCHTSHDRVDDVLAGQGQQAVCGGCHLGIAAAVHRPYAHPLRDGVMQCSSCHALHDRGAEVGIETCFGCHEDKRGPFLWDHPPVQEDCGTCHDAHGSSQPGMLTVRGPFLCQACHTDPVHAGIEVSSSGLPNGTPSARLLASNCANCHAQIHGSNHPSGAKLMR